MPNTIRSWGPLCTIVIWADQEIFNKPFFNWKMPVCLKKPSSLKNRIHFNDCPYWKRFWVKSHFHIFKLGSFGGFSWNNFSFKKFSKFRLKNVFKKREKSQNQNQTFWLTWTKTLFRFLVCKNFEDLDFLSQFKMEIFFDISNIYIGQENCFSPISNYRTNNKKYNQAAENIVYLTLAIDVQNYCLFF